MAAKGWRRLWKFIGSKAREGGSGGSWQPQGSRVLRPGRCRATSTRTRKGVVALKSQSSTIMPRTRLASATPSRNHARTTRPSRPHHHHLLLLLLFILSADSLTHPPTSTALPATILSQDPAAQPPQSPKRASWALSSTSSSPISASKSALPTTPSISPTSASTPPPASSLASPRNGSNSSKRVASLAPNRRRTPRPSWRSSSSTSVIMILGTSSATSVATPSLPILPTLCVPVFCLSVDLSAQSPFAPALPSTSSKKAALRPRQRPCLCPQSPCFCQSDSVPLSPCPCPYPCSRSVHFHPCSCQVPQTS